MSRFHNISPKGDFAIKFHEHFNELYEERQKQIDFKNQSDHIERNESLYNAAFEKLFTSFENDLNSGKETSWVEIPIFNSGTACYPDNQMTYLEDAIELFRHGLHYKGYRSDKPTTESRHFTLQNGSGMGTTIYKCLKIYLN